jgi:HAD superfamily hydrolase (TIGR01509 family)
MIELVLFDMDGTVFESYLDWPMIREALQIGTADILESIYEKNDPKNRGKMQLLENFERENSHKTKPKEHFREFLDFLLNQKIKTALITNNNRPNTDYLLNKFHFSFDLVITREMKLWKPNPAPMTFAMSSLCVPVSRTVSIGDSTYDIRASQRAGIGQIYLIKKPATLMKEEDGVIGFSDYRELRLLLSEKLNVDAST